MDSLRSSFTNHISRQQAVQQWEYLCYTNSIDDFLDKLVRLQWTTEYTGDVVKDKLERFFNYKLAKKWAAERNKPYSVDEQIKLVRNLGHNLKRYEQSRRLDKGKGRADDRPRPSSSKPEENKTEKQKGKQDKKRKREGDKDWKD